MRKKTYSFLGIAQSMETSSSCFGSEKKKEGRILIIKSNRDRFLPMMDLQENNCTEMCDINLDLKLKICSALSKVRAQSGSCRDFD